VASRKIQKYYNNRYCEFGITAVQSLVLLSLLEDDGQNIRNLAQKLSIDSSVTGLIDRLEKEQLVKRVVDAQDRRSFQIFLTKKGKKIANCIFPIAMQTDGILRSRTDGSDQNFIDNILEELDNMLE
jgi:DNA-binding MarR family transcriptional regulator